MNNANRSANHFDWWQIVINCTIFVGCAGCSSNHQVFVFTRFHKLKPKRLKPNKFDELLLARSTQWCVHCRNRGCFHFESGGVLVLACFCCKLGLISRWCSDVANLSTDHGSMVPWFHGWLPNGRSPGTCNSSSPVARAHGHHRSSTGREVFDVYGRKASKKIVGTGDSMRIKQNLNNILWGSTKKIFLEGRKQTKRQGNTTSYVRKDHVLHYIRTFKLKHSLEHELLWDPAAFHVIYSGQAYAPLHIQLQLVSRHWLEPDLISTETTFLKCCDVLSGFRFVDIQLKISRISSFYVLLSPGNSEIHGQLARYDTVHHFIKPATLKRKCSYVELVAEGPQLAQWLPSLFDTDKKWFCFEECECSTVV